ncbi:hypothetical protein Lal_00006011 [Lupinus albus]|uniref:Uncharacterized protein n=1 Tax=Lupinus albus TaxID=3870 RepID=A0A6A4QGR6_LUPAL|nr:hypothetical protein Lalb_Chr06g0175741 [Lupinus albus]KAF1879544.1 hypothetical protein Lal_00006011 [Lupinus albus]
MMGFSKKKTLQQDSNTIISLESESKKCAIAGIGISVRSLKPINTKGRGKENEEEDEEDCTTPTTKEARIPEKLKCPMAPRKKKPTKRNNFNGVVREFFNPPDLETVFKYHVVHKSI